MSKRTELLEVQTSEKPERDPNQLYFCCPECGHSALSFVEEGVTICHTIVDCVYRSVEVELGAQAYDLEEDYFFECAECEYRLRDDSGNSVKSTEKLVEWLEKNCDQEPRSIQ